MRSHLQLATKMMYLCALFGAESQIHMITESQLNQFQESGYLIQDDFLPHPVILALASEIDGLQEMRQMRQATIGKAEHNQINTAERGDFIHWIDPLNCTPHVQTFLDSMDTMRLEINRNFYLGIRDFECHFTQYPAGTHYKRHVDRHQNGSSRRVSVVLYLNANWQKAHGGELMLYTEQETHCIEPVFGRLAMFLSEIEHEVLPTLEPRKSLTGWLLTESIL